MGGVLGLLVPFLLGVDSCGGGSSGSPIGGGGGSQYDPPPEDTADTGDSGEHGGDPGPLTNCDPQYTAVWVECDGKNGWLVHAEMNVAVQWIDVKFHGTGEGTQITESLEEPGVFEGTIPFSDHPCTEAVTFDLQAMGTMFSTYECSYDYTP